MRNGFTVELRRNSIRERTASCQKAASEGIVLLKNEKFFHLQKDTVAALLGYRSGENRKRWNWFWRC